MLLQSHDGAIHLLPALPAQWASGSFRGLKARGGFIIDMNWQNGQITYLKIKSTLGGACPIRTNAPFTLSAASRNQKAGNSKQKTKAINQEGALSPTPASGLPVSGFSSNVFFEVPKIPTPIIHDSTAVQKPAVKKVYQYELATSAGGTYVFGTDAKNN